MTATQARIAVAEWIALARSRRAAAVAALGATGMPALALSMLDEAMRGDDDGAGRDLEIVEVAEWTSVDDVNAALGSGSAVVLAAGYRDGAVHFAVGRFRAAAAVAP